MASFLALYVLGSCGQECEVVSWPDADADGFGDPVGEVVACARVETYVRPGLPDCDDGDGLVNPGAEEACDGVDNDCDGFLDEGDWYDDEDGDGYGDPEAPQPACAPWLVDNADDCDDLDPELHDGTRWFADGDGDGVGAGPSTGLGCVPPAEGHVPVDGDCDDADPARFPGAREWCDGVDQDCGGDGDPPDAWAFPELAVRLPVAVAPGQDGVLSVDVDFGVALLLAGETGSFAPGSLRAAVHDCGGPLGTAPVPVAFVDEALGVLVQGGGDDPLGDATGSVLLLPDALDGVAEVGVYFHGDPPPPALAPDPVEVGPDRLASAGVEATFDAARGGLLATLSFEGGASVASQADADFNGIVTAQGPLDARDAAATVEALDAGPLTAALRATGHCERDGAYDYAYTWRMLTGRPELWVEVSYVSTATLVAVDPVDATLALRPFTAAFGPGLASPSCASGADWVDASDGAAGVAWAWADAPLHVVTADCDATSTWAAANDLPNGEPGHGPMGEIAAGLSWVDDAVLVLRPYDGAAVDGAWLDARLAGAGATAGYPERR